MKSGSRLNSAGAAATSSSRALRSTCDAPLCYSNPPPPSRVASRTPVARAEIPTRYFPYVHMVRQSAREKSVETYETILGLSEVDEDGLDASDDFLVCPQLDGVYLGQASLDRRQSPNQSHPGSTLLFIVQSDSVRTRFQTLSGCVVSLEYPRNVKGASGRRRGGESSPCSHRSCALLAGVALHAVSDALVLRSRRGHAGAPERERRQN